MSAPDQCRHMAPLSVSAEKADPVVLVEDASPIEHLGVTSPMLARISRAEQ
jgi:hypothetical protein